MEKGIVLMDLLLNSTDILKTLVVAFLGLVKATWRSIIHDFRLNNEYL